MKKFLALFLVLVLAFSCILVSCDKKDEEGDPEETDDEGFIGLGSTAATTTGTGSEGGQPTQSSKKTHTEYDWTIDTEGATVYVVANGVNVRSDTDSRKVEENQTYRATANFGDKFVRIRYNDEWTQIKYNEQEYYISSAYVTTNSGKVLFTNDAEESTVYVISASLNLRNSTWVSEDTLVTSVNKGAELTRIATSSDGSWIRVRYTFTPVGAEAPVTRDDLYCKVEFVSANPTQTTAPAPSLG